jgi:DNA polymerase III subunit epsilon
MEKENLIFIDTETTGLDPKTDSIIEIACVKVADLHSAIFSENTFHTFLNTDVRVSAGSFRVHGISNESLIGKPRFIEVGQKLLDFIGNSVVIAHNASFDINFINAELVRIGLPKLENKIIDSLSVAKKAYPGSPVGLDALMKRFGMSSRNLHSALEDAQILSRVYSAMCAPKQENLFASNSGNSEDTNVKREYTLCKASIKVSQEDLLEHEKILNF